MKMIIAIAALLATTVTASAYRHGDTKVFTSINTIVFNGVMTYDQVCLNGNNLETINPRKVCVSYKRVRKGGENETVCAKSEMQILSKPLDYVKKVCVKTRRSGKDRDTKCVKYKSVAASHATSYTVKKVQKRWSGSRENGNWGFGKVLSKTTHEVPACN